MDFELVLACLYMLMECPRCGLEQPKDKYCASCGLDVEQFLAKPKPLLVRLLQNSNLHLSLIGILIVLVVGYLFLQRGVGGMDALLRGTPLSSRDSLDPNAPARERKLTEPTEAIEEKVAETVAAEAANPAAAPTESAALVETPQKVEVSYWEIPRDALASMLSGAEKLGESGGGRAYFWAQGGKAIETVEKHARRISPARNLNVENGTQLEIETPPTTPEAFQFGLYFQIAKADGKDANLKWESTMVLPPPETAAEAASRQPVVKSLTETTLSGTTPIAAQNAVLIVFEPSNRTPRQDYITKAGEGPWTVLSSDAFRAGATDWVVLVQLKSEK